MSAVPSFERPPRGLRDPWLRVWRRALKTMKEQGSWSEELRPLLDEYVYALRAAAATRDGESETAWDRHAKRAAALADQLALTPRGRKAAGVGKDLPLEDANDPFVALDREDELAKRRRAG